MFNADLLSVLLVEDDANLGFVIKDTLEEHGFTVMHCLNGVAAWQAYQESQFAICILDIMLPELDGMSLLASIRQTDYTTPVIFLTAKSLKEDRIAGLRAGADDYLIKPFSVEELILRIEALLRRTQQGNNRAHTAGIYALGSYRFNFPALVLTHPSGTRTLTQREAGILLLLCQNPDKVLKRDFILQRIWGNDDYFMGRSLDVFISRLRKYLKSDVTIEIANVHGVGFKLAINP